MPENKTRFIQVPKEEVVVSEIIRRPDRIEMLQGSRYSPGHHTYKLTFTGYQDNTGTFDIIAGQITTINISMTKTPSGASVSCSGIYPAQTTPFNTNTTITMQNSNMLLPDIVLVI